MARKPQKLRDLTVQYKVSPGWVYRHPKKSRQTKILSGNLTGRVIPERRTLKSSVAGRLAHGPVTGTAEELFENLGKELRNKSRQTRADARRQLGKT